MKDKFERYVAVQYSGLFNMITQANEVIDLIEVSEKDYIYIQNHYMELKKKYPEEFKRGVEKGKQYE